MEYLMLQRLRVTPMWRYTYNACIVCTYYMIYAIYLLQLGFHPVVVVGKIIKKRNTFIQKEKQYTKIAETQNT